ncbi:hypothetical protein RUM44_005979 [Polyplax serrata]|uniref:Uncharacterized protein n=1 Tax=Polyplax serrata TaxID=468196 RepID=A0ABR1AZ46_POLSC
MTNFDEDDFIIVDAVQVSLLPARKLIRTKEGGRVLTEEWRCYQYALSRVIVDFRYRFQGLTDTIHGFFKLHVQIFLLAV